MKGGREGKGAASADLLVCFPSRAHLSLMPKSICSPARPPSSEHTNRHRHPHHRRNKSTHASPLVWAKNSKPPGSADDGMDEPTSPKVTCAGQIKVRPTRSSACRNWQSVMEEIERIHTQNANQKKKKTTWSDSLGFKKDVLQFLTCLRSIRFDFRCFGSFPHQDTIASDDEEEDDEDEDETQGTAGREGSESEASTTVFSKWFMVLQENKARNCEDRTTEEEPAVPPPNALFLMRCRSAPAQTRLLHQTHQEKQEEEEEEAKDDEKAAQQVADEDHQQQQQQTKKKKRESLAMVMKHDTDFNKLSPDIAKETWVVMDPFSRSRSWKRW